MTQSVKGKEWEDRILARIVKMTVYIPKGVLDANKIHVIHHTTLRKYIETEGYGK